MGQGAKILPNVRALNGAGSGNTRHVQ